MKPLRRQVLATGSSSEDSAGPLVDPYLHMSAISTTALTPQIPLKQPERGADVYNDEFEGGFGYDCAQLAKKKSGMSTVLFLPALSQGYWR